MSVQATKVKIRTNWRKISFGLFSRPKRDKLELFGVSIDVEPQLPDFGR